MTNEVGATKLQVTMLPSFSLYVSAEFRRAPNLERISQAVEFGDSITIGGPKGRGVLAVIA